MLSVPKCRMHFFDPHMTVLGRLHLSHKHHLKAYKLDMYPIYNLQTLTISLTCRLKSRYVTRHPPLDVTQENAS